MATRTNNNVTIEHEHALRIAELLSEHASSQFRLAERTSNVHVKYGAEATGLEANELANRLIKAAYSWKD